MKRAWSRNWRPCTRTWPPGWAHTPAEIVTRLNAEIVRITRLPEVQARIAELGSEATATSAQDVTAMIQRESAQWKEVIRARSIRFD